MKYLLLFTTLFCTVQSYAQVTLSFSAIDKIYNITNNGSKLPPGNDEDYFRKTTSGSALPSIPITKNGYWDLSTATYNANIYHIHFGISYPSGTDPNTGMFPTSKIKRLGLFQLGEAYTLGYTTQEGHVHTTILMADTSYTIGTSTGTNTDSIQIPSQRIILIKPDTLLKLPTTSGTHWKSNYSVATNFFITYASQSLIKAPATRKLMVSRTDSVVGWGKMKVKTKWDATTHGIDVLQVKTRLITIDSVFLNGTPAPSYILSLFQMTKQGQADTVYTVRFFRLGEVFPLAEVVYNKGTYADIDMASITIHQARLDFPASVNKLENQHGINIYPNPAPNRTLTVEVADISDNWKYELINKLGQTITAAPISTIKSIIHIDNSHPSGTYYLCMRNKNNDVVTEAISIQ